VRVRHGLRSHREPDQRRLQIRRFRSDRAAGCCLRDRRGESDMLEWAAFKRISSQSDNLSAGNSSRRKSDHKYGSELAAFVADSGLSHCPVGRAKSRQSANGPLPAVPLCASSEMSTGSESYTKSRASLSIKKHQTKGPSPSSLNMKKGGALGSAQVEERISTLTFQA